jgi:hypothetical protein
MRGVDDLFDQRQKRGARAVLVSNLQQARAPTQTRLRQRKGIHTPLAAQRRINDWINDGAYPAALNRYTPRARILLRVLRRRERRTAA